MASIPLIDQYLAELRRNLGQIRGADEICTEARDHLLAALQRHYAAGMDLEQAQRRALSDYGDSRTVARSFLNTRDGVMVPRPSTRFAGAVAVAAAMLWFGLATWSLATRSSLAWDGGGMFWVVRTTASMLTFWAIAGLITRHGGAGGALGIRVPLASLPLIFLGQATVFTVWSVPSWLAMLSLATVLVGTGLWSAGIAPRMPSLLFAAGPLVGIAAFWGLTLLTGLDTNGIAMFAEDTGAFTAIGTVPTAPGVLLFAAGLAGLGHWMHRETPVEGLEAVRV